MIVGLPDSIGYDAILVLVDRLTKMVRLMPTTGDLTSEGAAHLYRDNVWKLHGLPYRITSDRGV